MCCGKERRGGEGEHLEIKSREALNNLAAPPVTLLNDVVLWSSGVPALTFAKRRRFMAH